MILEGGVLLRPGHAEGLLRRSIGCTEAESGTEIDGALLDIEEGAQRRGW